jgi:histone-lysine N-methyltransferase SETMAR
MLTIVSNPRGFYLIDVLAKGRKFNTTYYVTEILSVLSKWCSTEAKGDRRTLIAHAENGHLHTTQLEFQFFEQNRMKAVPYPPYSPDLAPSDRYIFGYINECMAGLSFENADELLQSGRGVVGSIEKVRFQTVFLEWMERFRKCTATNDEYVEESTINVRERLSFIRILVRCSHVRGTPGM